MDNAPNKTTNRIYAQHVFSTARRSYEAFLSYYEHSLHCTILATVITYQVNISYEQAYGPQWVT